MTLTRIAFLLLGLVVLLSSAGVVAVSMQSPAPETAPQLVTLTLLAVFAFSFRDSMKTAQAWGAFMGERLSSKRPYVFKLASGAALLAVAPLVLFFLSWRAVQLLPSSTPLQAGIALGAALLLGITPRGTKHFWLILARKFDWAETNVRLPPLVYSLQVIGVSLLVPVFLLFYLNQTAGDDQFVLGHNFWLGAFVALYAGEMALLYEVGRGRLFFERKERWLWSLRMLISIGWTVVVPLAFGLIAAGVVSGRRHSNTVEVMWLFPTQTLVSSWQALLSFGLILVFLGVPVAANQAWHLEASRWLGQVPYLAVPTKRWLWKLCFFYLLFAWVTVFSVWLWD